ncbi:MAG: phosphoribosylamine--glycine ligase [Eubacteriales bacterium]|nr:phosphoribosylamine--glycine ligase [Eubacteriales bacterium]
MKKINVQVKEKLSKDKLKILIVGGGGREHAIAKALHASPRCGELLAAPGNAGIAKLARCFDCSATDLKGQVDLALNEAVDLVIVAPDDPLAMGLCDRLWTVGIPAFGPSARAARIEASKHFAKEIMSRAEVPTAAYHRFVNPEQALAAIEEADFPLVVKADGLALGKGVIICQDAESAKKAVQDLMCTKVFGEAGAEVLFEEFIEGPELTVLALSDGKTVKLLPTSRDHKRAFDSNQGPNTGGMGAISPVPELSPELLAEIEEKIVKATLAELERSACPFKGVLYCGLILSEKGPQVIEFNARFGDPEAQAVIPLIESDFLELILAVVKEELAEFELKLKDQASAVVVLASGGYPGEYEKGKEITGLDSKDSDSVFVYHCGTRKEGERYLTNGGRVLAISAQAETLDKALDLAYAKAESINFEAVHYRRDIGRCE